MGRMHNAWSPSVSAVHSRFMIMNVTSSISHKITYNISNAQTIRFTTLSKPQNTKISSISVQAQLTAVVGHLLTSIRNTRAFQTCLQLLTTPNITILKQMAIPHTYYFETRNFQPTFIDSNHTKFHVSSKRRSQNTSGFVASCHMTSA